MPDWYRLAAMATRSEVEALEEGLDNGSIHPGEAKRDLGRRVVAMHHDTQAAESAEVAFDRLFRAHEVPHDVPVHTISAEGEVSLPTVLADAGLVASRSEGRRMIKQGAVKVAGERINTEFVDVSLITGSVIQVGKRRFARIELA
jgi:tyrosyl-tRNA synthetase